MSDLIDAAREYLTAGFSIIWLRGKRPHPKLHPHGLLNYWSWVEISDGPQNVEDAASRSDVTGVGILIPPGMLVADVDSDESAAQMPSSKVWARTPIARTKHGLHVWWLAPGIERSRWVGKLLLRGAGSYVVAPPSEHPNGGRYEWIEPLVRNGVMQELELCPMLEHLKAIEAVEQRAEVDHDDSIPMTMAVGGKLRLQPDLRPLVMKIEEAGAGNRNNMLSRMVMWARDGGVSRELVESTLGETAIAAGLTAQEVRATIRAAYRRTRHAN